VPSPWEGTDAHSPRVPLLLRELPELSRVEKLLGSRADADALLTLLELLRVARDAYGALETYLDKHGLTDAKWVLLVQLFAEPSGRLLPSALAKKLLVTRGAISGLVRGAERAGFVRRVAHPTDHRKYFVVLLPRGRRLVAQVLPGHIGRITKYMSVLSPSERRSLGVTLRKLYAALPLLAFSRSGGRHRRARATG
jgi:MarR family transcriptional regulator, negative regulator of the multidrug operon emrRAB